MQGKIFVALTGLLSCQPQTATCHPTTAHLVHHRRLARSSGIASADQDVEHVGNIRDEAIRLAPDIGSNPYTMEFRSTASTSRTIVVWNKVGLNGANSGSFNSPSANFTLDPGNSQIVVFEPNTQGGFCDFTDGKKTPNGQYDCPYGEFNIAPQREDGEVGWSAADVSTYNQDPAPEGLQMGKGRPCNLNIGAVDGTKNSTCQNNYYWAAAGTYGLGNDLGCVVPKSEEAHFVTVVEDMKVAS